MTPYLDWDLSFAIEIYVNVNERIFNTQEAFFVSSSLINLVLLCISAKCTHPCLPDGSQRCMAMFSPLAPGPWPCRVLV
jgi:hypothetical protein